MIDLRELRKRVGAAIERITTGHGQMRIPVDSTELLPCKLLADLGRVARSGRGCE